MTASPWAARVPAPYRLVLLVGAPRSGTTWLQRLLGAHPEVATAQETDLLDKYVGGWLAQWEEHLPSDPARWASNRHKGLPAVLTEAELVELLRGVVRYVYDKVAHLKPAASVVLDKNPDYALVLRGLGAVLGEHRVIHLVRDGRDVAASLARAGASWGASWAPVEVGAAARRWQEHVVAGRSVDMAPTAYMEVRYEDLLAEGEAVLGRCLDFCGLRLSQATPATLLDRFPPLVPGRVPATEPDPLLWSGEVMARMGRPPPEPHGFTGQGRPGLWRSTWTAWDRWLFDQVAGELLITLGYERDRGWVGVGPGRGGMFQGRVAVRRCMNRGTWAGPG